MSALGEGRGYQAMAAGCLRGRAGQRLTNAALAVVLSVEEDGSSSGRWDEEAIRGFCLL